jgi:hypothetical protein
MNPLTPYLTYIKIGAALALVFGLLGTGWHFGGASQRDADDKRAADQLGKVVKVMEQRQVAAEAESTRRQGIIDAYDRSKASPNPIVAGLGERVLIYSRGPGCPAVPGAVAVAGGTDASPEVAGRDERVERLSGLTQAVYTACDDDAAQMTSMIDMATPNRPPR